MTFIYSRKVQFYETDAMQIVHHANYIRWLEEARTQWLEDSGYSYLRMEDDGVSIPVLSVHCDYKQSVTFGDTVHINVQMTHYDGVRMSLCYRITHASSGRLTTLGSSTHCFIDKPTGRPTSLKRSHPEMNAFFLEFLTDEVV